LGRRSTVTSPLGLVTTYNYEPQTGDLTSTVIGAPFNYTTSYGYNTEGLQTMVTHPDGTKEESTYDALGRRTGSIIREANNTIVQQNSLTYNALGQVATSKDGNNNTTSYTYNALGLLTTTTLPNARTQTITTFDNSLNPVNITSPTGQYTTIYRDIFGRTITTIQDTVTHTKVYENSPEGLLLGTVGGGKSVSYSYDALGRTISSTSGNVSTTYAWNDVTRTASTSTAGRINTQTRDLAGRVIATKDGLNRITTIAYTINAANKTLTSVSTNHAGQATTQVSNALGQTISTTNANNETTTYVHDALGRQISYTDPKTATFSFLYNAAGQRTRRTEPDTTYQTYTYDLAGNMIQHRKADGTIATITYTNLNQPDLKTWSGSSEYTDWTYNNLGRLISMDNQTTTTQWTYNNSSGSSGIAGTLVQETTIHKNLTNLTRRVFHAYDSMKRLSALSVGDSGSSSYGSFHSLSYTYYPSTGVYNYQNQNEGLLQSINNEGPPPLATYNYNGGLLNNIYLENNTYSTITRDAAYQITSYSHPGSAGNTGTSAQYGYDNAGRRKWVKYEDNLGQAYAYDNAGQVTHAKVGIANANTAVATSSPTHFYDYDLAGNREQVVDSGVTTNYTPNAVNAYTAISGSANPTYDPNGNLLTGPIAAALASLTYDQENRLTTSNLGGSVNSYTYDALGRISTLTYSLNGVSTTEVYTWTGWTLLYRELIQNAVAIEKYRYTWGLDVSGTLEGAGGVGGLLAIERNVNNNYSWDIRYPHYDANGNIMALSNSSGQISARYRYDAFGKTILSTDVDGTGWNTKNIHSFSTKPTLGNHKLHYYGYRWYDASNGRWINRDPIEEKGGLNLYGFVYNKPYGWIDVLGREPKKIGVGEWALGWCKRNPNVLKGLTPEQIEHYKKRLRDTRNQGCIGLTCVELGVLSNPDLSNCFETKTQAEKRQQEMIKNKECSGCKNQNGDTSNPRIFSVHYYNDKGKDGENPDVTIDESTGKADMSNWDWKGKSGNQNDFDFGYIDSDGNVVHANHCHDPNGLGPMQVYINSLAGWQRSYSNYNSEVWCVACEKDDMK
jgi:RHS repeat-associated protein